MLLLLLLLPLPLPLLLLRTCFIVANGIDKDSESGRVRNRGHFIFARLVEITSRHMLIYVCMYIFYWIDDVFERLLSCSLVKRLSGCVVSLSLLSLNAISMMDLVAVMVKVEKKMIKFYLLK